jgi:glycosyltransferase involved in cell wall biosynthesis
MLMTRLRILFLAYDVDLSSNAGDSVHVRRLSEELAAIPDCDLKVVCRRATTEISKTERYVPVVFPRMFSPTFALVRSLLLWRKMRFNIVFERGGTRSAGLILSRVFNIPLVLEADGFIFENLRSFRRSSSLRTRLTKWIESRVYQSADMVVVASDSMAEILVRDLGVRQDRIRMVPIGADIQVLECGERESDRGFGEGAPVRLCYAGAMTEWHGLDTVVEAFRRSSFLRTAARVTLVGEGYHRRALMKRVSELGLDAYIDFTGEVPHDRVVSFLVGSDACLAPQIGTKSGPSIKVLEYMSVGKPIIASRIPDHGVIESEHLGLLFNAQDPDDFADKVSKLVSDYPNYSRKAERGRLFIQERYNWRSVASGICAMLREVVSGSPVHDKEGHE